MRARPRGKPGGCASWTLNAGPKSPGTHLLTVCDTLTRALLLPRPVASTLTRSLLLSVALSPLRASAVVPPASQPHHPEAYPCRVSRVGAAANLALRPPALLAPAAVPLRAALAPRAAAPAVPLSPLVWPPGRGGREQPEEEPQPGGGGRSPWRTVKEAARRKCATTMTVSGRGVCSGDSGKARWGVEGGSPRGHGLPSGRVSATPAFAPLGSSARARAGLGRTALDQSLRNPSRHPRPDCTKPAA